MIVKIYSYVILILMMFSCNNNNEKEGIGTVDISCDDSNLLFSYYKGNQSGIYLADNQGHDVQCIIKPDDSISYTNPSFSPSCNRIAFIGYTNDNIKSNIFISNIDGSAKKQLTFQDKIITEVIFSKDEDGVFFCKSNEYKKYSPVGTPAPHVTDIYYLNFETLKTVRITELDAYDIHNIKLFNNGKSILFKLVKTSEDAGLFAVNLNDKNSLIPFNPLNSPRESNDMYDSPSVSEQYNILAFTAPYELYIMDLNTKLAKFILRPEVGDLNNVVTFNKQRRILFINRDTIRTVNYDGTGLKSIGLKGLK